MSSEMIYDTIKQTVLAHLPDSRVLLFGSRARGDHDQHSDYDLMVVTTNQFTAKEKVGCRSALNKALVHALNAPFDVLFSEDEIIEKQNWPNHIVRSAIKDAVAL